MPIKTNRGCPFFKPDQEDGGHDPDDQNVKDILNPDTVQNSRNAVDHEEADSFSVVLPLNSAVVLTTYLTASISIFSNSICQ